MGCTFRIVIAFVFVYQMQFCQGQNLAYVPVIRIALPINIAQGKGSLPFSSVAVIDARYDTTCVGFLQDSLRKIAFIKPAENEIEGYISKSYSLAHPTDSSFGLAVLLEKLWVSSSFERLYNGQQDLPVAHEDITGTQKNGRYANGPILFNTVIIKAKLLAKIRNEYHPLYQIDSFYLTPLDIAIETEGQIIENGIDGMLYKAVNKYATDLKISRKQLSSGDINSYVADKLSSPILKTTTYNKGVFKTFEEFKDNTPSFIGEFEITKTDKDRLFAKDSTGLNYPLNSFYAYSDGVNLFVYKSENLFKLYKENKGFVFWGFNTPTKIIHNHWGKIMQDALLSRGKLMPRSSASSTELQGQPTFLQIDMDSGDSY